ncbi:MAG: serine hydrolase domain-containing protein [Litorimonas sp.]
MPEQKRTVITPVTRRSFPNRAMRDLSRGAILCSAILASAIGLNACTSVGAHAASPSVDAESRKSSVELRLPRSGSVSDFEDRVQTALSDKVAPGLVFVVMDEDRVVFSKGYGYADIERRIPATPDTIFPLGSISKTFIGTAAAIAHHDQDIDLEAPISDYLSFVIDDPRSEAHISWLHLATHTSGIIDHDPAYEDAYAIGSDVHPLSLSDFLRAYLAEGGSSYDASANFSGHAPGAAYNYSNIASGLAALALGDGTGIPFEDYSRETIFMPLGMDSTVWFLPQADRARVGTLYERDDEGFSAYPPYALATWPDGGLRTTARDLSRYLLAFMNSGTVDGKRVFDKGAVDLALGGLDMSEVDDVPDKDVSNGLFWGMSKAPNALQARPLVGHNGVDPGIWTLMQFDPVTERGVIAIANADMDSRETMVAFYSLAYRLFLTDFPETAATPELSPAPHQIGRRR